MDGRMDTPTEADILTLAQWFSPAYPVGSFAYSHGLEWLVETGAVREATTLRSWLEDILEHGSGRTDAIFLAAAFRADGASALAAIDAAARAFAPSKERLMETDLQGAAFCRIAASVHGFDLPPLTYPVAIGRAARLAGIPLRPTAQMYAQAVMSNLVTAAMRLMPLGQTEGHRLIRDLTPTCARSAVSALAGDLDDLSGTAFLADLASMRHETQHSRIFRT
jgi:urease accessory protein